MKYIACADLHIRSNRPQYRKDDYFKTVCRKFKQIIYLCNKHNADLIVAGDFFDSTKIGFKVLNTVLTHLKKLNGRCLVVAGQHDMSFHQHSLVSSPLQTLIHTGRVQLLKKDDPTFDGKNNIYGCSFGEEPFTKGLRDNSILVIHKTITPENPPFFLPDAISAAEALYKWQNYNLIISGDYHQPFRASANGSLLINCGPMMRQSIDQMELEPTVYLIAETMRPIKLKIEPYEDVFALESIKRNEESEFSRGLEQLIETLKDGSDKPDYKDTVNLLMKEGNISDKTKDKVNSIMGSVIDE